MSSTLPNFDHSTTFHHTEPPHPTWTFGEGIETSPDGKQWMEDGEKAGFTAMDPQAAVRGVVPRPIAFVSSRSTDGIDNLAPFSWFNQVNSDPPLISISIRVEDPNTRKDTERNILETKEFTVNIISEPFIQQANSCSVEAPSEVSEWIISGLTKMASDMVKPPRVKESAFSVECTLFQTIPIVHPEKNIQTGTLILGLVKRVHARNDVLTDKGAVDMSKLKPVTRLGGISYGRVTSGYRLPRPKWKEDGVDQAYESLKLTRSDSDGL